MPCSIGFWPSSAEEPSLHLNRSEVHREVYILTRPRSWSQETSKNIGPYTGISSVVPYDTCEGSCHATSEPSGPDGPRGCGLNRHDSTGHFDNP
jgi:hypothetical protein